jgi:hypothetical protein
MFILLQNRELLGHQFLNFICKREVLLDSGEFDSAFLKLTWYARHILNAALAQL